MSLELAAELESANAWADRTFATTPTDASVLDHLREECRELLEAPWPPDTQSDPDEALTEELADVLILLGRLLGPVPVALLVKLLCETYYTEEVCMAIANKMAVNRVRPWSFDPALGRYTHEEPAS